MNYVVAYPWPQEPTRLSIFTYGTDVQQNCTEDGARWLLAYAKQRSPGKPWAIYRVEFTAIDGVKTPDDERDAARYRWLRQVRANTDVHFQTDMTVRLGTPEQMDAAIDAAMEREASAGVIGSAGQVNSGESPIPGGKGSE